jgi:hypothetical protein
MSRKSPPRASFAFDLALLTADIRQLALEISGEEPDPALVAARLCDGLRDAGASVPSSADWAQATSDFSADTWQRLTILVRLFCDTGAGAVVSRCLKERAVPPLDAFCGFCGREAKLLTLELLLKSPFRVEELARKWIYVLTGAVSGEAEKDSRARLERLDFGDVLKNLDAADRDRAARVRKLKELEERRLKEQQEAYQRSGRE